MGCKISKKESRKPTEPFARCLAFVKLETLRRASSVKNCIGTQGENLSGHRGLQAVVGKYDPEILTLESAVSIQNALSVIEE